LNILTSRLHEYDVIELRDVIDDVTNRALAIGHESINRLVSEIFSIKVADRQTHRQTGRRIGLRVY